MKTKNQKTNQPTQEKEVKAEKSVSSYNPKINNVFKGKSLSFLLENVEVVKSNLNSPFHSKEYDSYSSSVGILLNEKLKKEIYDLLATSFKSEKNLSIALENFLSEKVKVLEDGREIFYASMKWVKAGNTVKPQKPLPSEGIEETGIFPYSFTGKIQVGFSFSDKFTFPCYLNGVIVEKVLQMENSFSGFSAKGSFSPSVTIQEEGEQETIEDEVERFKEESQKGETVLDKVKKRKFW